MSENKIKHDSERKIFEQLDLEFDKNAEIFKIGQFFEHSDDDNELYLIHYVRSFVYNKDRDSLTVSYICEKMNSSERDKYDINERTSLLDVPDGMFLNFTFKWEDIQTDIINSQELINTITYQEDEGRLISFLLKDLENLEFIEDEGKTYLNVLFNVQALLPVPESEKKQIKMVLSKSKFNIISQEIE